MPKELPGFYYDAEKNRYFPYKGPIPGSSSSKPPPAPPPPDTQQVNGLCKRLKLRPELLQARELCGDVIYSSKRKLSFRAEYQNIHASQPLIWKYKGTKKMANISMEHVVAEVILPHGIVEREILLSGGLIGLLCAFQVGKDHEEFDPRQIYKVDSAWPVNPNQIPRHKELLRHLGSLGSGQPMASDVSCVAVSRNSSPRTDGTMSKHFVITTLGNAHTPGCVYILDWSKPLDFPSPHPLGVGLQLVAKFNQQTLWTADCDPQGTRTAVGTNRGVALLDIETKSISWVLRSKSDVLSVQFDHSGNSIHCGLRNGAILTVDTRQRQTRNAHGSSGISMPSSVCSLASLKRWDQYLLGSSMDGSMKLYDNRLIKRGAVQSYEGNVNSHTRIQIGVDPSEKVVTSGGEDFCLRLWNIKSGEMLFKERFMNTVPSAVCWPRSGEDVSYWQDHCSGAWLGSYEGIFYMDWL